MGDHRHIGLAQSGCRLDQRIEYGLQIEGRAADHLEHVGGGGLLLQRFAQLIKQASILNGDDRLICKILHQRNVLGAKGQNLLTKDLKDTDQFALP